MTRFLVAPVAVALMLLAGSSAYAAETVPGVGQCVRLQETETGLGLDVCPPIG